MSVYLPKRRNVLSSVCLPFHWAKSIFLGLLKEMIGSLEVSQLTQDTQTNFGEYGYFAMHCTYVCMYVHMNITCVFICQMTLTSCRRRPRFLNAINWGEKNTYYYYYYDLAVFFQRNISQSTFPCFTLPFCGVTRFSVPFNNVTFFMFFIILNHNFHLFIHRLCAVIQFRILWQEKINKMEIYCLLHTLCNKFH